MRVGRITALAVAAGLALSACGGSSDTEAGDTEAADAAVELRFSWWGNDARAKITQEAIDRFQEQNPNITIRPEFADFDGYFDRLATSVAGGDAPDVITLGGAYPREYGDRGALLDLSTVSEELDTSMFPEAALGNGNFNGTQYGVPTGVNTYAVLANPRVFEEAGVALPDDDTWTWEDYVDIANEISANSPEGVYGTTDPTSADALDLYSRQQGRGLYTEDGQLDIDAGILSDWWTMSKGLMESGGAPEASMTTELAGQPSPEQTLMGRGLAGLQLEWSNQYAAFTLASGDPLVLLRAPGESEQEPGMWLQASQLYTISAKSEHPEEAARFVDFLVNDPVAGKIIKTDRGIPANPDVLAALEPELTETEQVVTTFMAEMAEDAGTPLVIGPTGSTESAPLLDRLNAEVLFDRMSVDEASEAFVDQLTAEITR